MKRILYIILAAIVLTTISISAKAQYCTTNLYSVGCYNSSSQSYMINNFSFGPNNMFGGFVCNTTMANQYGYADGTVYSTNLASDTTYNITLHIASPDTNNYVKAWIDYNNDLTFNNTNELIFQINNVASGNYYQTITIPTNAVLGAHRLRVRMVSGHNFANACDTATYGITNDFTVNIGGYNDIGVDSIIAPADSVAIGSGVYAKVRIHNYGNTNLITFPVLYSINGGIPIAEIYNGGTLAPGNSVYYEFNTPYFYLSNNINVCAWTYLSNDVDTSNDRTCKGVYVIGANNIDAGVDTLTMPGDSVIAGDQVFPSIYIHNYGSTILSNFIVGWSLNNVPVTTEIYNSVPLIPGSIGIYVFNSSLIIPSSNFTICFWVKVVGDVNTSNDSTCKLIYSSSASIIEAKITNSKIHISPNPSNDYINVNCSFIKKGKVKFSIYNIQGSKLYMEEDVLVTTDNYNKHVDVSSFKSGIYFLKIENDSGVSYNKFIKE